MTKKLFDIGGVFALLSIVAVGGGTAVLPQMKYETVTLSHWLSPDQFTNIYGLGQLAPGPNMVMVSVIGYQVTGLLGALVALAAFFGPSSILTYGASRLWDHFSGSPWRESVQRGMAPITIGLMLSGVYAIGKTAAFNINRPLSFNLISSLLALLVALLLMRRHINPALLILGGAALGGIFLVK